MLSGCGSSSISSAGLDGDGVVETTGFKTDVTGTIVQTSAGPAPITPPLAASTGKQAAAKKVSAATPEPAGLQAETAALTAMNMPTSPGYRIGPADVLEISVFKVTELSKTAQVSENGTIALPLVGEVQAAGRTPRQMETELARMLGNGYLQKPQITVFVKEFNSQRVTIEGAVKKPGVFPIQGRMTLLQILANAQGLDTIADDTVLLVRTSLGKREAARFDISQIRAGSAEDPQLQAGDVVIVGTSALKEGFGNIMKLVPLVSVFTLL